jgi:F-type H+-transporting ATPase subunit gamma
MPNMRDIRLRMKSITQTLQITSAMKLISTSKLRRARTQLTQTEPYFNRIQEIMADIVRHGADGSEEYFQIHDLKGNLPKRAFLVITSDKGLAGGFNHNVINLAESSFSPETKNFLLLHGSIGARYFIHKDISILENFKQTQTVPTVYEAKDIADFVIAQYLLGIFDEFNIVYTRMYSSVKLIPEVIKVLPLDKKIFCSKDETDRTSVLEYCPSQKAVINTLVPKYIAGVIYGAMVESFASEHCARMAAMDSATKNAQDMLATLELTYNRLRQADITQEITEIVAGAAALNA